VIEIQIGFHIHFAETETENIRSNTMWFCRRRVTIVAVSVRQLISAALRFYATPNLIGVNNYCDV